MAQNEVDATNAKDSGGSLKIIVIALVVLLLIVIGVGVALFVMMNNKNSTVVNANGEVVAAEVMEQKTPIYVPLEPTFLANFEEQSQAAYLQVNVQIMTYDEAVSVAVGIHMPKIRNDLLWLFGSQKYEELNTVKGKRELSKKAIEVVSKVLKDAGEPDKIEAFLFTSFVMQ
ncbi:MAG: flagellar basal body-associated FliL family protein [Gammaproteobacteria bacterium]|nr:flagellar basal body-associated FliL family protein [Gammaproteobacteria bacterium]